MSRKLLVLAASQYQIETIKCARRSGFYVITLDNRPDNPGHRLADKSFNIDTTDVDAVLEVARQEAVQGVISPCTDVAVPTAAHVAERLGLNGPSPQSAQIACSKTNFRNFLKSNRIPAPEFLSVDCDSDPPESLFIDREWILKPERSSGSKGVFRIRSKTEFNHRLAETLSYSPGGRGILERYLEGLQGTCEGFLNQGELALACVLDRKTAAPPYVTTCGHYVPSRLEPKPKEVLFSQLREICRLLEITDGPFDCDFVAADEEVYVLEISPRIGGNCISMLLRHALGFDIVECSIHYAMGEFPAPPPITDVLPAAAIIFGVPESGQLVYDLEQARLLTREPWVDSLSFDLDPGSQVAPFINSRNRVGQAIVSGESRVQVENRVRELERRLCIRAVRRE